jgi:hypothetical protein
MEARMKHLASLTVLSCLLFGIACSSSSSDGGAGGAAGGGTAGTAGASGSSSGSSGTGGSSGTAGSGGMAPCVRTPSDNAICQAYSADTPVAWDCVSSDAFNELVIAHTGGCQFVDGLAPNGACCDN